MDKSSLSASTTKSGEIVAESEWNKIEPSTFANDFLVDAVNSPSLKQYPGQKKYLRSLLMLVQNAKYGKELAIVQCNYKVKGVRVKLFDIKCKARFEDDVIQEIYDSWNDIVADALSKSSKQNKGKSTSATSGADASAATATSSDTETYPCCPFRRGMCIGEIGSQVFVAVGNIKFMYGSEEEIAATNEENQMVVLSEKANGEYSLCTCLSVTNPKTNVSNRWIVVGSKNVRFAAPFDETGKDPLYPIKVFQDFLRSASLTQFIAGDDINNVILTQSESLNHRYSYLINMMGLWLKKLITGTKSEEFWNMMERCTIVGEQIGVHSHIYTSYTEPDIRVFGALDKETLSDDIGCSLIDVANFLANKEKAFQFVSFTNYNINNNEERAELQKQLVKIASGSMEEFGEGVVVYKYGGKNRSLRNIWKFKNEEYAFDRRLRTLLSPVVANMNKYGVTVAQMQREIARLQGAMMTAGQTQFVRMNRQRLNDRVELIPYLFAFLERHQVTQLCSDFSENFSYICNVCEESKNEYRHRVARIVSLEDPIRPKMEAIVNKYKNILEGIKAKEMKTREEIAVELSDMIAKSWKKYPLFGIAAAPGSGKSTVLHIIKDLLLTKYKIDSEVLDRDAFVIEAMEGEGSIRPDVVTRRWIEGIAKCIASNKVALVGNCFTGDFADQVAKQVKANMMLAVQNETSSLFVNKKGAGKGSKVTASNDMLRFYLVCLERLLQRDIPSECGSTLTMGLGGRIVMDKFFSTAPDASMVKNREANGSLYRYSALRPSTVLDPATENKLFADIIDLHDSLTAGIIQTKANKKQESTNQNASASASTSTSASDATQMANPAESAFVQRRQYHRHPLIETKTVPESQRVVYLSIIPIKECAFQLYRLAHADIIRTDGHVTLKYDPDTSSIKKIREIAEVYQKKFGDAKNSGLIKLPLTSLVSVRCNGALLQFVVVDMEISEEGKFLSYELNNRNLHVTLGSTDVNILAHAHSGVVLEKLVEINGGKLNIFEEEKLDISLKIPKQYSTKTTGKEAAMMEVKVQIEPLKAKGKEYNFVGIAVMNCI